MAGITQLVDERIEAIRKERAELAALRESLEAQQAALKSAPVAGVSFGSSGDDDLSGARAELARIREEKAEQLMRFGAEMDKLRDEKTAETEKRVQELNGEIAFLLKGRKELEDELNELRRKIASAKDAFEDELTDAFTAATIKARERARARVLGGNSTGKKPATDSIATADELAKMKLAKIAEIEEYLAGYKEKRLAAIEKELAKPKARQRAKASKAPAQ